MHANSVMRRRGNKEHEEPLEGTAGSLGSRAHPRLVDHSVNVTTKLPVCVGCLKLFKLTAPCMWQRESAVRAICESRVGLRQRFLVHKSHPTTRCVTGNLSLNSTVCPVQFNR